jgi:small GTP-binding protein
MRVVKKKVVILGDSAVGKTSLIRRFVLNTFDEKYVSSIGARVSKKRLGYPGNRPEMEVVLMVWDLMGSKESSRLHEMYYRGADGAIVVSDITRLSTIENMEIWVNAFRSAQGDKPALLVYNKVDLEGYWTLDENGMEGLAARYQTIYYKTSAKTGANVEIAFYRLAEQMLEKDYMKKLGADQGPIED